MNFSRDGRSDEDMRSFIEVFDYGDDDTFFYLYDLERE